MNNRKDLNGSQLAAVNHNKGPMMVLAGPGSGKTTVITRRTLYLVEEKGVNPEKILVITFTRAAAQEMKERFIRMCGGRDIGVNFGTFHAIFYKILKYAYNYNSSNILSEDERQNIIGEIVKRAEPDREDERDHAQNVAQEISKVKNERIDLSKYYSVNCAEDIFRRIYKEYEDRVIKLGKLDFDDMVLYCYELLSQRQDILSFWQSRYEYVLIDEFQDINLLQYETIKLLALPENNIFIVGDDDQSIYSFRGANPAIMKKFEREFEDCRKVLLNMNYRSGDSILSAAGNLIANNRNRFDKKIKAVCKCEPVAVEKFKDQKEQNLSLVKDIIRAHESGIKYKDMAVLFRTNLQPRSFAEKLMEFNVPFKMRDKSPNIFDHFIATNFFDYINIACGSADRVAALRIINRPKRYISRECFEKKSITLDGLKEIYAEKPYIAERIDKLKYDLTMIKKLTPMAAIRYIRKVVGYDEYLKEYSSLRNIRYAELDDIANELEESAEGYDSFRAWYAHIDEYRKLVKESQEQIRSDGSYPSKLDDRLQLMTFHSAKGLEFERVYIIDANEGVTPYEKAKVTEDIEEERRMFYVAMTRAKSFLKILYTEERFGRKAEPSRFLGELLTDRSKLHEGAKIIHAVYGCGEILSVADGRIRIKFEELATPRLLDLNMCIERQLIKTVE